MINIVLFQPEIPSNTGNISRTCVGTSTRLHLIKPLGFLLDDKHLKRAGLDYWKNLDLIIWDSFEDFLQKTNTKNYFLITKFGNKLYYEENFKDKINEDIYVIFGRETKGLPENFRLNNIDKCLKIPMSKNVRSLNLSNTVAIVLYEILRQQNFKNL